MSYYRVEWEAAAVQQLSRFDERLAAGILVASDDLADGPLTLSRPARPPFFGHGQEYECEVNGRSVVLTFKYGQDEETIHVFNVSVA